MASLEEEGELTGGGPTRHLDHHVVVGWTCSVAVVATFVASTATRNYSQVDKLWSIMPVIYAWQLAVDRRTAVMAALVTIWGARLTYNFARRGGYAWWPPWRGGEDYRWAYIADGKFCKCLLARANPLLWHTFNFAFISLYQNLLLLLLIAPSIAAKHHHDSIKASSTTTMASPVASSDVALKLNWMDGVASAIMLSFILIEAMADNQQYAFQTRKRDMQLSNRQPSEGEYADGFCQSGLFSIVRKPNYAAEQAIWISFYGFTVAATNKVVHWSAVGWVLLILLFQGSGWLTEEITKEKYGSVYSDYQQRVPLYVPGLYHFFPPRRSTSSKEKVV